MFYCYQILYFSMSNYLNAYKLFLFILTVALWNVSEILCCVFKFYSLSDEGIKHWFNLYLLMKLTFKFLANEGDLLLKLKYFVIIS